MCALRTPCLISLCGIREHVRKAHIRIRTRSLGSGICPGQVRRDLFLHLPSQILQMDLYRTYAWIYLWICLCHIMIFMISKSCRPITPNGGKVGGGHRAHTHTHTHIRTYSWIYSWSYSGAIPGLRPGSIACSYSGIFCGSDHFVHDLYELNICLHTTHKDGTVVVRIASGPIPGSYLELFLDLYRDFFWTYFWTYSWTYIGTSPGAASSGLPRRLGPLRALGDLQSSGTFPIPGPISGPLLDLYLDLFLDLALDLFLDLSLDLFLELLAAIPGSPLLPPPPASPGPALSTSSSIHLSL